MLYTSSAIRCNLIFTIYVSVFFFKVCTLSLWIVVLSLIPHQRALQMYMPLLPFTHTLFRSKIPGDVIVVIRYKNGSYFLLLLCFSVQQRMAVTYVRSNNLDSFYLRLHLRFERARGERQVRPSR